MPIYTRAGDAGETALGDGRRVRKDDARVEAYGAVDEANSTIGVARGAPGLPPDVGSVLALVQAALLHVGADLAAPEGQRPARLPRLPTSAVAALEAAIDRFDARLPTLRHFVLPAGGAAAAALHVARTVTRRAERRCVALAALDAVNPNAIAYLNRLSDLLFVLARYACVAGGLAEEPWIPRG